jgi:protein-tyrosine phosphatase
MSVSEIVPGLWVGSHPPKSPKLANHFDLLVLAAREYQPEATAFGKLKVLHAPLKDDRKEMPTEDKVRAFHAATQVMRALDDKKKVLVTCWEGLNRSSLIAALALVRSGRMSRDEAIARIRSARTSRALSNPHFETLLGRVADD